MRKKSRVLSIIITAVLLCALALSALYLFALESFTVVTDSAFNAVLPSDLRFRLAVKGLRLRTLELDNSAYESKEKFITALENEKSDYILLGPLSASYAIENAIDISALLPDGIVLAFSKKESPFFDCTLVSDEESGWILAARAINSEIKLTSQNVAILYENNAIDYIQAIVNEFGQGRASLFESINSSSLSARNFMSKIDAQGIVLVLTPFVRNFDRFLISDSTVKWVVDYRFAPALEKSDVYGVVGPSWDQIINEAGNTVKGSAVMVKLGYEYEKR